MVLKVKHEGTTEYVLSDKVLLSINVPIDHPSFLALGLPLNLPVMGKKIESVGRA